MEYLDEAGHGMVDFTVSNVPEMAALSIAESPTGEKGDAQASTSTSEMESILVPRPQEARSVPVPLMQTRIPRVVKEEQPETLAVIDLTEDELREKPMTWLQNLARKARDAQEVAIGRSSSPREMDVICLSDSDEADEPEAVVGVQEEVEGEGEGEEEESVDNETQVNLTENMMQWSEGANSESTSSVMAKNREMLDSITSNLDEVPVHQKLPTTTMVQMVEKGQLSVGGLSGKSAIKFGVRDDLVGSSPRKVTTVGTENVAESQGMCQQQQQSQQQVAAVQEGPAIVSGESVEEDSQNSVENYNIFNEIRMMERGGENFEAPPPQSAIFQDNANYFCEEDFTGLHRTSLSADPKVLERQRRRQSTEQTENVVFSFQRRPLATNEEDAEVISSSGSSMVGTTDRVLFSMAKPAQLPMEESLNNIVRDIMADFSDVDDVLPDEEDGSMDDEPDIESPSMETIEKADLVEFMEICERRNQSPEHLKSILDRSTPQEKSAKVKKKVKFGTTEYHEVDDYPRQRDFFGGMSPRKAILKSSLKKTMLSTGKCSSGSGSGSGSVQKRLPVKETTKSPSNIMVKMTYVSPEMLQNQQQTTTVKGVAASVDSDVRSTDSETGTKQKPITSSFSPNSILDNVSSSSGGNVSCSHLFVDESAATAAAAASVASVALAAQQQIASVVDGSSSSVASLREEEEMLLNSFGGNRVQIENFPPQADSTTNIRNFCDDPTESALPLKKRRSISTPDEFIQMPPLPQHKTMAICYPATKMVSILELMPRGVEARRMFKTPAELKQITPVSVQTINLAPQPATSSIAGGLTGPTGTLQTFNIIPQSSIPGQEITPLPPFNFIQPSGRIQQIHHPSEMQTYITPNFSQNQGFTYSLQQAATPTS
uniref:Uncharacterized protein n=1 Tax=Phlebotomus papatasi TaxID=29031 RepID=A0A1B0DBF6_PHLPP